MADKTLRAYMEDAGFSEDELTEHLDRLSKEIMGLTLMRIFELFPQDIRESISELPEEDNVKEIMARASQYLTKDECHEIEREVRQKHVDTFFRETVEPRLAELSDE